MSGLPTELAFLIQEVLTARAAGEHERCTEALNQIFDLGTRALFAACLGWAEVVARVDRYGVLWQRGGGDTATIAAGARPPATAWDGPN